MKTENEESNRRNNDGCGDGCRAQGQRLDGYLHKNNHRRTMKKIPFNLQEWLSDKSQKVVTRDGRPVEILKTNMPGELPLLVLYDGNDVERVSTDGKYQIDYDGMNDLFFVTEDEPELTEFEKSLADIIGYAISAAQVEPDKPTAEFAKGYSETLLSIARKQIEAEVLKDLPRWKKISQDEPLPCDAYLCFNGNYLHYMPNAKYVRAGLDGYYLPKTDIEKLPKE